MVGGVTGSASREIATCLTIKNNKTMKELNFRTLRADEIDVRVGAVKEGSGVSFLLYKDARVDMVLLDEVVGALNWKREHKRDNANCVVSIWDEDKREWVSKEDTGAESNTDKEKGLASDSFKRACFNWGIGRELYTAPFIWISGNTSELKHLKLRVKEIAYDDNRNIVRLVLVDNKGNERYKFGAIAGACVPLRLNNMTVNEAMQAVQQAIKQTTSVDQLQGLFRNVREQDADLAELMTPDFKNRKKQLTNQ